MKTGKYFQKFDVGKILWDKRKKQRILSMRKKSDYIKIKNSFYQSSTETMEGKLHGGRRDLRYLKADKRHVLFKNSLQLVCKK